VFSNTTDDPDRTMERFDSGKTNVVVSNLAQALGQIFQWQRRL
jgi:hypothetical protein